MVQGDRSALVEQLLWLVEEVVEVEEGQNRQAFVEHEVVVVEEGQLAQLYLVEEEVEEQPLLLSGVVEAPPDLMSLSSLRMAAERRSAQEEAEESHCRVEFSVDEEAVVDQACFD